jgi:hypothetical protein
MAGGGGIDYAATATDIFLTNGADIPSLEKKSPKYWNRLFNDGMKFTDVTEATGGGRRIFHERRRGL